MLDSCMRMRIKDFTDKDMNGEPIDFNGYPGRAFIFEGGNNTTVTVKEFFANNRKYDLCVVAKSNQGTSTEIGTFFNSFQIIH